jgi:hypothetical protein
MNFTEIQIGKAGYLGLLIRLLVCVLCLNGPALAQSGERSYHTVTVALTKQKKPKKITTTVQLSQPAFPRGDTAWIQSLQDTLDSNLPYRNRSKPGTHIVAIRFLLERDGSIADISLVSGSGFALEKQVLAIVRRKLLMGNRWAPAPVRTYKTSLVTPTKDEL